MNDNEQSTHDRYANNRIDVTDDVSSGNAIPDNGHQLLQKYYCVDNTKVDERKRKIFPIGPSTTTTTRATSTTEPYRCTKNPLDLRIQIDYPKEHHDYMVHQLRIQHESKYQNNNKDIKEKKTKKKKNRYRVNTNQYYYDETGYYHGYNMGIEQRIDGTEMEQKAIRDVIDMMNQYWFEEVLSKPMYQAVRKTCKNRNELCAFWASVGECENNRIFMLPYCPAACRFCLLSQMNIATNDYIVY